MAEKDLYHNDGNKTVTEYLGKMSPKNKQKSNPYNDGNKGAKSPTSRSTQKGWSK